MKSRGSSSGTKFIRLRDCHIGLAQIYSIVTELRMPAQAIVRMIETLPSMGRNHYYFDHVKLNDSMCFMV